MRPGRYTMQAVDVVKSVAGLYRHMKDGVLNLTNTVVDIDGDCEIEKNICIRLHLVVNDCPMNDLICLSAINMFDWSRNL